MELPPIHPYQSKVEQLKATLKAAGETVSHSEVLKRVAEKEGFASWNQLPRKFESTLMERIRAIFGVSNRWRRNIRVGLDELFYDHPDNRLRFGVYGSEGEAVDIGMDWARRHVLLISPTAKGATVAMDHIMAQQIVAGGGLIVFDPTVNNDSAKLLNKVATESGRDDFQNLVLEEGSVGNMGHYIERVVRDSSPLFVHVPYLRADKNTATLVSTALRHLERLVRIKRDEGTSKNARPLMLVFPDAPLVLTREWIPFIRQARAFNVMLVIRLHGMADLKRMDSDLADELMNCGTKVFFQPSSIESLEATAMQLAMSKNEETLEAARASLAELGLGESIVSRGGVHRRCKTCIINLY